METHQIKPATLKAGIATSIFVLEGIIFYLYNNSAYPALVIFYIVLCFNTFFSIRLFDSLLSSRHINQKIIDAVLFVLYTSLAWNLSNPVNAMIITVVLFLTATYKYTHMITYVPHTELLRRKISIDNTGSALTFLVCIGIIMSGNTSLLWYWTVIFILANIYLFTIMPLYKVSK